MRHAALTDGAYLITDAKPPRAPKVDAFTRDAAEFRNWYRRQMPIYSQVATEDGMNPFIRLSGMA